MHRSDASFNSLRDPNVIVSPGLLRSSWHIRRHSRYSSSPAEGVTMSSSQSGGQRARGRAFKGRKCWEMRWSHGARSARWFARLGGTLNSAWSDVSLSGSRIPSRSIGSANVIGAEGMLQHHAVMASWCMLSACFQPTHPSDDTRPAS